MKNRFSFKSLFTQQSGEICKLRKGGDNTNIKRTLIFSLGFYKGCLKLSNSWEEDVVVF